MLSSRRSIRVRPGMKGVACVLTAKISPDNRYASPFDRRPWWRSMSLCGDPWPWSRREKKSHEMPPGHPGQYQELRPSPPFKRSRRERPKSIQDLLRTMSGRKHRDRFTRPMPSLKHLPTHVVEHVYGRISVGMIDPGTCIWTSTVSFRDRRQIASSQHEKTE